METIYQSFNFFDEQKNQGRLEAGLDHLLAAITRLSPAVWREQPKLVERVNAAAIELTRTRAKQQSSPILPKLLLFEAEIARLRGQDWTAMELFDRAITQAEIEQNPQVAAQSSEAASRFWLAKNKPDFAALYFRRACDHYQRLGMTNQADALSRQYGYLLDEQHPAQNLPLSRQKQQDFQTVLEVWHTLSNEISLEPLLKKIIEVVLTLSGAERACLILDKDRQWVIEAEGFLENHGLRSEILHSTPVKADGTPKLATRLIQHVARTKEVISLVDARNDDRFGLDEYILARQPKSLLCMPFLNQIRLTGMLYVEDSRTAGIFTPEKIEALSLLSTQAAISIETAILYESLEAALASQAKLTNAYSRFVPREFLQFLGKNNIAEVQLGDQIQREMTVLFSDIRAFTTLSEQMTPQENFQFINTYFSRVSPLIRKHNGFIDKYIGDAVMALFPGEADDAVQAAIAMQLEVVKLNQERAGNERPPIKIGVGLHRGSVMLGTVGETMRMEGTVISDAVNLASRLEGLTKLYGAPIVISEQTLFSLNRANLYNFRFLDKVTVKGKKDMVSVFEIFDGSPAEISALKLRTRTDFEKGLLHYHSQEFREAIEYFNNVLNQNPKDRAAQVYLRQATHCLWIGLENVKVLTEKL